jgi:hypothetical protein
MIRLSVCSRSISELRVSELVAWKRDFKKEYHILLVPHTQVDKWHLYRYIRELVATGAEWTPHYFCFFYMKRRISRFEELKEISFRNINTDLHTKCFRIHAGLYAVVSNFMFLWQYERSWASARLNIVQTRSMATSAQLICREAECCLNLYRHF